MIKSSSESGEPDAGVIAAIIAAVESYMEQESAASFPRYRIGRELSGELDAGVIAAIIAAVESYLAQEAAASYSLHRPRMREWKLAVSPQLSGNRFGGPSWSLRDSV